MIIKFSLVRLSIIFLLVILFPLVQKQWLNLYLFDINNFSIYKILYYLSGLVVPILVIINSLNNFTYYKFINHKKNNNNYEISGKVLFLIIFIVSITLSILVTQYIFINLNIFLNFFNIKKDYSVLFDIDKQILIVLTIAVFLLFKKTKLFIKKFILINFCIFSIITWYSQINNYFLIDKIPFYLFKSENINYINIVFLLAIDIVFYLWSYISYNSNLSDWKLPKPYIEEVTPIVNIFIFYLFIILYYSIVVN